MAITISVRPRTLVYMNSGSPAAPVYSNWNAAWNPVVYEFSVPTAADRLSSLFINIYEVGSNTLLSSDTVRPFTTGNLIWDVAPFVRAYLYSAYSTNFTTDDNCKDYGNSLNFYITYTQIFDNGTSQIFNSDQTRPISVSCSAMQFGDSFNGSMLPYVPFNTNIPDDEKMKFLSAFEVPVMWSGYQFTLSYIYGLDLIGVQAIKEESQLDINQSTLSTDTTDLEQSQIGYVNYLKINEPSNSNTQYIKASLHIGEAISTYYVEQGYVTDGYQQIQ